MAIRILLVITVTLTMNGCAIRRPVQALYCAQMDSTGRHCAVWPRHPVACVHDAYGDCTPGTR
jgi:hypothetical protein